MNLIFALLISLLATAPDSSSATSDQHVLYPSHIDFGTVPVWATSGHLPIRWADLGRDTTSSVYIGPKDGDLMVMKRHGGYAVLWPLYTAILNGDTLTYRLLGSDHERVMAGMGYSDNTPYDLRVTLVTINISRRGKTLGQPRFREMTKRRFDQRYGGFIQPTYKLNFGLPLPPPQ